MNAQDVLHFWFEELGPDHWFSKNQELDEKIKIKFADLLKKASKGELFSWRSNSFGRLAEIIVLDQFSRNIHRDQPEAFENDKMALLLAQEMVELELDQRIPLSMRAFVYMPYMHSESKLIHKQAVKLFSDEGMEENLDFEVDHKKIIDQFGRFPHRNSILHRPSTPSEKEFMKTHQGY